MGIGAIIGVIGAVVSAVGGIAQANAQQKQADAMADSARAQREANRIEGAQQEVASRESRRQRIREQRIRRAQILAASENQGTSQSSGAIGATSALGTNLGTMNAFSLGESRSNAGINSNMQRAADFTAQANRYGAQAASIGQWTNTISGAVSGFGSIFDQPRS